MLLGAGLVLCLAYLLPNHYSPWLSFHQSWWPPSHFPPVGLGDYSHFGSSGNCLRGWCFGFCSTAADGCGATVFYDRRMDVLSLSHGVCIVCPCWGTTGIQSTQGRSSSPSPVEVIWTAMLFAALISSGLALHQWLTPTYRGIYIVEIPPESRPFGNLAQPNQLATLLLLGIAGLVYLWRQAGCARLTRWLRFSCCCGRWS